MDQTDLSEVPGAAEAHEAERERRAAWVMDLRSNGVSDYAVLGALEAVDRRMFLYAKHQALAYADRAFPIDCGQMSTPPSMTGKICGLMELKGDHRVLEIGTGSGYQSAILSKLVGEVVTLERYRTLAQLAEDRIRSSRITNVTVLHADGLSAVSDEEERGQFDRILLNGCVDRLPGFLLDELLPGGKIYVPIRGEGRLPILTVFEKAGRSTEQKPLGAFRFLPLTPGIAAKL
ncbi:MULTISPECIES: protein-L-isoaspartate O-methyltransferase family protein [Pseudovibrio]|uniref:protein-L-isoaspartate O-methyltransferase family protein n=1 Tax=Stappiaceae TaxID=2821832 RepID=UPI002366C698|nr:MULTISPECIES: rRNA adenine N-6-methyltransferase family protein [Pseudovibrio]MDD7908749.1 rRNA adenine N-6-methyltransferase family protein [Pseudovibrio exalbescens]MDX5592822.1 rRNA adenine N-6-methyltransferase family protein [Pseudovibrio sp. SPO723]